MAEAAGGGSGAQRSTSQTSCTSRVRWCTRTSSHWRRNPGSARKPRPSTASCCRRRGCAPRSGRPSGRHVLRRERARARGPHPRAPARQADRRVERRRLPARTRASRSRGTRSSGSHGRIARYGKGGRRRCSTTSRLPERCAASAFNAIVDRVASLSGNLPDCKGNAQLSPRLDQLSRWFPPVDHLDRALFVIAFNALGCIADPRFALPVAPAPVFFGGCALAGRG